MRLAKKLWAMQFVLLLLSGVSTFSSSRQLSRSPSQPSIDCDVRSDVLCKFANLLAISDEADETSAGHQNDDRRVRRLSLGDIARRNTIPLHVHMRFGRRTTDNVAGGQLGKHYLFKQFLRFGR